MKVQVRPGLICSVVLATLNAHTPLGNKNKPAVWPSESGGNPSEMRPAPHQAMPDARAKAGTEEN